MLSAWTGPYRNNANVVEVCQERVVQCRRANALDSLRDTRHSIGLIHRFSACSKSGLNPVHAVVCWARSFIVLKI